MTTTEVPITLAQHEQLDPVSPLSVLMSLQTIRRHCIRSQSRADRSIEAFIASFYGYRTSTTKHDQPLTKDEREKMFKLAKGIRTKIEQYKPVPADIPPFIHNMVKLSMTSREHWDLERKRVEDEMEKIALQLPVWEYWARHVRGFGALGLAVLVAEAKDIGAYPGPGRLWRRYGLGFIDGTIQGAVPKGLSREERKEAWKKRRYKPERRSHVYAFIEDSMFRNQWRGDRDEDGKRCDKTGKPVVTPAHPLGPYGEIYGDRREWNLARGLTPKHADNDARRIMAKKFIRDLWVAWMEAEGLLLPAAEAAQ